MKGPTNGGGIGMNTTKITIDALVYSVCLFALLLLAASDFWAWYSGTVSWVH